MFGPDRYTILEEIASGSTATVYLAEDTLLRRKVALKKLHPHLHNHVEMVKRFAKEAVAIAALSHANIIKVFEYGNQDRNLFLAMEYIDGMNLEALMKTSVNGLPNLVALTIFRQLLEGLGAAHARGIYHRDIKPSNVLVDRKGCVHIADFGIAFLSEETSITRTGSYLGTPGYSAPEQAEGLAVSDKTDIFSTGILFYRCLTGRLPFEGETPHAVLRAIMEKAPAKAATVNRRILPGFQELFEAMLAKNPIERPSAAACIEKLEGLARESGFIFEPQRLARFLTDEGAYRAREERELSEHFLDLARQRRSKKEIREALKAFSLAEAFSADPEEIRTEAEVLLKRLRVGSRNKILAAVLAAMILPAGVAYLWPKHPVKSVQDSARVPSPSPASQLNPHPDPVIDPVPAGKDALVGVPPQLPNARPVTPSLPAQRKSAAVVRTGSPKKPTPRPPEVPGPKGVAALSPVDKADTTPEAAPTAPVATRPGYLMVKTSPPFADLFVDGHESGSTPTKSPLELKPGDHELILERAGCRPLHTAFKIASDETTTLRLTMERSGAAAP